MSLGMSLEELLEKAVGDEPEPGESKILWEGDTEKAESFFKKGLTLLKKGKHLLAAAHFLAATVLDPAHTKAWNNLGVVYFKLGEIEEAREAFKHVLQIDPENPQARKNLELLENKFLKNS